MKYYLFDAKDRILGRLATKIACVLRGKNKVGFTSHIDDGDAIVVINAQQVSVSGKKEEDKIYFHYTGYPGGIRQITLQEQREKDARKIISHAVIGMLPKNKLSRQMQKRLFVYNNDKHPHKNVDLTYEKNAA